MVAAAATTGWWMEALWTGCSDTFRWEHIVSAQARGRYVQGCLGGGLGLWIRERGKEDGDGIRLEHRLTCGVDGFGIRISAYLTVSLCTGNVADKRHKEENVLYP